MVGFYVATTGGAMIALGAARGLQPRWPLRDAVVVLWLTGFVLLAAGPIMPRLLNLIDERF